MMTPNTKHFVQINDDKRPMRRRSDKLSSTDLTRVKFSNSSNNWHTTHKI